MLQSPLHGPGGHWSGSLSNTSRILWVGAIQIETKLLGSTLIHIVRAKHPQFMLRFRFHMGSSRVIYPAQKIHCSIIPAFQERKYHSKAIVELSDKISEPRMWMKGDFYAHVSNLVALYQSTIADAQLQGEILSCLDFVAQSGMLPITEDE